MLSPWSTTYELPRRAGDQVRVLTLAPTAEVARQLRIPGAGDGGGAVIPSFSPVVPGERVDITMRDAERGAAAAPITASGVVREVLGRGTHGPRWVHIVVAPSHAHRVRRMIELANAPVDVAASRSAGRPTASHRPGSSMSGAPPVIEEVSTLRVRGTVELLEVLKPSTSSREGGGLELAWRGARAPGQRVQVEVSFGPMADEIVLAGVVAEVTDDARRSIPVARIEIAAAHRHRVHYVVEVLRGIRDANTRAHRRVAVQLPGRWWVGAHEQSQLFGEMSRAGTFVRTARPPRIGASVPLEFDSPRLGPVRVPAEVVWVSGDPNRSGFGARFKVRTRALAETLSELIEREARPALAWA